MDPDEPRGLQQRIEESVAGRAVISAFLALTLLTLLVIQLPGSHLRAQALRLGDPYSNALGLDQGWALFAPDPRRVVIGLEGRVTFADGSTHVWRPPRSNALVGSYWDFRWRKYSEYARLDRHRRLWAPLAAHVARETSGLGRPVRVELVRRWYQLLPPGRSGPLRGPWQSHTFFTLPEAGLRALGAA